MYNRVPHITTLLDDYSHAGQLAKDLKMSESDDEMSMLLMFVVNRLQSGVPHDGDTTVYTLTNISMIKIAK